MHVLIVVVAVVALPNPEARDMSIPRGQPPFVSRVRSAVTRLVARLVTGPRPLSSRRASPAAAVVRVSAIAAPAPAPAFTAALLGGVAGAQDERWRWLVNSPQHRAEPPRSNQGRRGVCGLGRDPPPGNDRRASPKGDALRDLYVVSSPSAQCHASRTLGIRPPRLRS